MSRVLMRCARSVASRTAARTGSSSAGTGACGSLPAYVAWGSALSPRCDLPNHPLLVLNACRVSRSPASDAREQPCRAYVGRQQPRAAARLPARVSRCRATTVCVLMLQRASNRLVSRATPAVCVAVVDTAQRALAHSASWDLLCTWDQDDDGTCVTAVRYVLRPRHPVPMRFMCSSLACWLVLWRGGGAANIRCRQAQRLEQRLV